jgi:hypothetical protein
MARNASVLNTAPCHDNLSSYDNLQQHLLESVDEDAEEESKKKLQLMKKKKNILLLATETTMTMMRMMIAVGVPHHVALLGVVQCNDRSLW